MMNRRDLIIGLGALGACGGAVAMTPRQRLDLMQDRTLEDILPQGFAGWAIDPSIVALLPPSEGSLADRLYDEILSRAYRELEPTGPSVMMLGTRGADQSDALQLHRPETCYPAFGFAIVDRKPLNLAVGSGAAIPAVALTAKLGERIEDIIYWTRIGNDFPRSAGEQRRMTWRAALNGVTGDGILMRYSAVRNDPAQPQFNRVSNCIQAMAQSIRLGHRAALFGTTARA